MKPRTGAAFILTLFVSSAVPVVLTAQTPAEQRARQLYSEIIEENMYHEKIGKGILLGSVGGEAAFEALAELLGAESYWDRTAAAYGLDRLKTPQAAELLVEAYLNDYMIEYEVGEIFGNNPSRYRGYLTDSYSDIAGTDKAETLLSLLSRDTHPENVEFLTSILEDTGSPDRTAALNALKEMSGGRNDTIIRSFLVDPELRGAVLEYIADTGTARDLILFTDILENREKEYYPVAFRAAAQWGGIDLQKRVLLEQLVSGDTEMIYQALTLFTRPMGDEVMVHLARLTRDSDYQTLRTLAAERLLAYNGREVVPAMISFVKEEYISSRIDGWDIFLAHVTLGLSALFNRRSEKVRRNNFYRVQQSARQKLITLTGVYLTTPSEWEEWAVLNGYTVGERSLVTMLYSGQGDKRKQAVEAALKLLSVSREDFLARHPHISTEEPYSLESALAGELLAGGLIVR